MVVSADYLKKPSLLGQPYFIREDRFSHVLYSGALFNYSMIPLILISGHDPIVITSFFTLLNLFTGLIIYLAVKRMFNTSIALASCLLFLFNDWMIYHSLFIWSYNFLPLIGILIFYYSWRYFKNRRGVDIFVLGLLSGLGVSLQFLFLPIALAVLAINATRSRKKVIDSAVFVFGMILGNLPMVIFDLRHNFYESRTLIQYFVDTLTGKSNAAFAYYYLLPFWPVLAALGGLLTVKMYKFSKILPFVLVGLYLFLNLDSPRVSFASPTGMPEGLKTKDISLASQKISNDAKGEFNVAEVLDFDKRAYILRYFVQYKYGKISLGETEYQNLNLLYVLSRKDYNFESSDVWEVKAGWPYKKVSLLTEVGQGYAVYKLQK